MVGNPVFFLLFPSAASADDRPPLDAGVRNAGLAVNDTPDVDGLKPAIMAAMFDFWKIKNCKIISQILHYYTVQNIHF